MFLGKARLEVAGSETDLSLLLGGVTIAMAPSYFEHDAALGTLKSLAT